MTNSNLLTWLPALGICARLSGRFVNSHPRYAIVGVLSVLVFSAFAARPNPD
jgi:hypothetical protein